MKVEITSQDHFGRGVARVDDKVVFVDGALPGEVCEIEIRKTKKKVCEAKVKEKYKTKSIDVMCPYYKECGGCDLMHQEYLEQGKFKEKEIRNLFHKFSNVDIDVLPIISGPSIHYRNKLVLHNLGLYQKQSHDVTKIEECLLVHPKINEIIKRILAYKEEFGGKFKEVMIRVSNLDEVLLSVDGSIDLEKFLSKFKDITCLVINDQVLTRRDSIYDKIGNFTFAISKNSFYQVNRFLTEALYNEVIKHFKDKKIENVLDLYCGVGTMTQLASPYVAHVTGIEIVEDAIKSANIRKKENGCKNVDFICGKVEDFIDSFSKMDAIIVDPPRSGLDKKTVETLLKIEADMVIYVSCDPVTLARDVSILKEKYEVKSVQPVDMFPNTHHVESVALLRRQINVHNMKLNSLPFEMIKSGDKTIELRLFDEKRQKIKAGDRIVFTNAVTGEILNKTVVKLHRFDNFEDLYKTLPLLQCGYRAEDVDKAQPSDMEQYYSVEKQKKYGVVGIELC